MPVDLSERGDWPPMLWIGSGQGAGKTTLSWHLSRVHDLPLHRVDLWAYDHRARLPARDSLDEELAGGAEAAAAAFESVSRLRLGLVLDDILARDLGTVPAMAERAATPARIRGSASFRVGCLAPARSGAHAPGAGGTAGKGGYARGPPGDRLRSRSSPLAA
jgi:hypothetical protein